MSELKPGQSKTFEINGQKLVVEPIAYGNLKKLIRLIIEATEKLGGKDNSIFSLPTTISTYLDQFVPLLFKKSTHSFLTPEWIDDNLTVPVMREIVDAAVAANGLQDFFTVAVKVPAPKAAQEKTEKELLETTTQPENSGSTISAGSPTVGVPETSTP